MWSGKAIWREPGQIVFGASEYMFGCACNFLKCLAIRFYYLVLGAAGHTHSWRSLLHLFPKRTQSKDFAFALYDTLCTALRLSASAGAMLQRPKEMQALGASCVARHRILSILKNHGKWGRATSPPIHLRANHCAPSDDSETESNVSSQNLPDCIL